MCTLLSELMGTLKGKLAIKLFMSYQLNRAAGGENPYWVTISGHGAGRPMPYFVNTVGINEDHIRRYMKYQETEDRKEENIDFDLFEPLHE